MCIIISESRNETETCDTWNTIVWPWVNPKDHPSPFSVKFLILYFDLLVLNYFFISIVNNSFKSLNENKQFFSYDICFFRKKHCINRSYSYSYFFMFFNFKNNLNVFTMVIYERRMYSCWN